MNLFNFIIRRLMLMVLVLLGVSLLVFSLMMIIPAGMRVYVYVGNNERITDNQIDFLIQQYGLNDPPWQQYFRWVGNIMRGDFGFSNTAHGSVVTGFLQYFPSSLEITLYATPLIILVGIWFGTIGALNKDKPIDHFTRIFSIVGFSLPTFWSGLLLLMGFYGYFQIFPPGYLSNWAKDLVFSPGFHRFTGMNTLDGLLNGRLDLTLNALYYLALPVINLVLVSTALIMRLMRSNMLEAMGQDYVRTALAKGADKKTVYYKHARRNALLPVITISGTLFAGLMGGLVITETIFNRPGLGSWMVEAARYLDVAAIMFLVLFMGTVFVIANLIVDILYAVVDPRVRIT